jgi:hypothetical protein
MADEFETPLRSWQEIAEEASKEKDPEKLLKLTHQLERALDKRDEELSKRKSAKPAPDESASRTSSPARAKAV